MRYKVEYKTPNGEWTIVKDHGCYFWEADSAVAALDYAKITLTDKMQKAAMLSSQKEAFSSRDYDKLNDYPDWQAIYIEINDYQWCISEWGSEEE